MSEAPTNTKSWEVGHRAELLANVLTEIRLSNPSFKFENDILQALGICGFMLVEDPDNPARDEWSLRRMFP